MTLSSLSVANDKLRAVQSNKQPASHASNVPACSPLYEQFVPHSCVGTASFFHIAKAAVSPPRKYWKCLPTVSTQTDAWASAYAPSLFAAQIVFDSWTCIVGLAYSGVV